MSAPAPFGVSITFSFVGWEIVTWQYIWPALSRRNRAEALRPIPILLGFRFVGLAFLVASYLGNYWQLSVRC